MALMWRNEKEKELSADNMQAGINFIKEQTKDKLKTIKRRLADELGNKDSTIDSWCRRYNIPQTIYNDDLFSFCYIIFRDSLADLDWFTKLLAVTDIPAPQHPTRDYMLSCFEEVKLKIRTEDDTQAILNRLFPTNILDDVATYNRFIGRENEIKLLSEKLHRTNNMQIIMLVGIGGIGKTTLAQETAKRCLADGTVDKVAWMSAKTTILHGETIHTTDATTNITYENVLKTIIRQTTTLPANKGSIEALEKYVEQLLMSYNIVLILDNLETVHNISELLIQLSRQFPKLKIMATSRVRLPTRTFVHEVEGLRASPPDEEPVYTDSYEFMRYCAGELGSGAEVIRQASNANLHPIHEATGGAPLAIRLVIAQIMKNNSIRVVMRQLHQASENNPFRDFYYFIYQLIWDSLSSDSQQLLSELAAFAPMEGIRMKRIIALASFEDDRLFSALYSLAQVCLLDRQGTLWNDDVYLMHPLTHHYILGEFQKQNEV